jgi:hypothetical protein
MGIVFTRAYGNKALPIAQRKAAEIAALRLIAKRVGLEPGRVLELPCWQVDAHPEDCPGPGITPGWVTERRRVVDAALDDALRWVRSQPGLSTQDFVYGEYHQRRETPRLAKEKMVYEKSVIAERTETRTILASTTTTPVFTEVTRSSAGGGGASGGAGGAVATGLAAGVIAGSIAGLAVGATGLLGESGGGSQPVTWTEKVHSGNIVTETKREEKRIVQTLVVAGDWTTVREWTEQR